MKCRVSEGYLVVDSIESEKVGGRHSVKALFFGQPVKNKKQMRSAEKFALTAKCLCYVNYSTNVTDLRDALKISEETKALPFVTMRGTLRPLLRKTDVDLPARAEFSLNGHVN